MASTFNLTYAGIPFLLDQAKVVRIGGIKQAIQTDPETNRTPHKHQVDPDLIDELNRTIPFMYLQDFVQHENPAGPDLDSIAASQPMPTQPAPTVRIGDWYYPVGATRWSVFRGLASSTQAKAMLALTKGNSSKTFLMFNGPADSTLANYSLQSQMYMLPPRSLAEHGGGYDGLYLITLVDERYYWQYRFTSFRIDKNSTWVSLLDQLSTNLGVSLSYDAISHVYSKPEPDSQLFCTAENSAVLLDAVAFNVGCKVVRNLNGTYKLMRNENSLTQVILNRGNAAKVVRIAGGDLFQSGLTQLPIGNLTLARNSVVPASVDVAFPKYVSEDDPVPHFLNSRYANQRPSTWYEEGAVDSYIVNVPMTSANLYTPAFASGVITTQGMFTSGLTGITGRIHTIRTTAKALVSGEAELVPHNASGLIAMSMQLASDYYGSQVLTALDEVYPGTYAWVPEGIHDILWTYSARQRQATTRVMRACWNQVVRDMQHSAPTLSGVWTNVPEGVGGKSVAQTIRDQQSGVINTTLTQTLNSGANVATFRSVDYFPTQNRWRAFIDDEKLLFDGTSGGISGGMVSIAYRGIDGTVETSHTNGSTIEQAYPVTTYGVNLVTFEKGQFAYPQEWTSGGIQGVRVVPQTQTVRVLAGSGRRIYGVDYFSGSVNSFDPTQSSGGQFSGQFELAWIRERNAAILQSGQYYDGQFVGYSPKSSGTDSVGSAAIASGKVSPIYAVNLGGQNLTVKYSDGSAPIIGNVNEFQVAKADFVLTEPKANTSLINTRGLSTTVDVTVGIQCVSGQLVFESKSLIFVDGLLQVVL